MCRQPWGSERGAALVVVLMLLVILSLMGAAAIMTTGNETRIAHNSRQLDQSFYAADAGVETAPSIIGYFLREQPAAGTSVTVGDAQVGDTNFINEVMGFASNNDGSTDSPRSTPDVTITLQGNPVTMDIDRVNAEFAAGSSAEMGGYESAGAGGAGGGMSLYYRATSQGQSGTVSSNVEVLYRYVL